MPKSFIPINAINNPNGMALKIALQHFLIGRQDLGTIFANLQDMTDGIDYSLVESQFGLPTGQGQAVFAMVANAVTESNSSNNIIALTQQTGVTR